MIADRFSETGIVLVSPPPVYAPDWAAHRAKQGREMDRDPVVTRSYADACRTVALDLGVPLVDLYAEMIPNNLKNGNKCVVDDDEVKKLLCDGLHLSAEGNQLLYRLLRQAIDQHYSHLTPDALHFNVRFILLQIDCLVSVSRSSGR